MIRKTLRSGTSVKYAGHVIVDGDVNPGAEVGLPVRYTFGVRLRGNAFAGIDGSQDEVIAALEIESPNLSIANIFYQEQKIKIKDQKEKQKKRI